MSNEFSVFYDTAVDLLKSSDEYGENMTLYKSIYGDMQYSSAQLSDREFGFKSAKKAVLYCRCADMEGVVTGDYVRIGNAVYRVEHVEFRTVGAKAILKETIQ